MQQFGQRRRSSAHPQHHADAGKWHPACQPATPVVNAPQLSSRDLAVAPRAGVEAVDLYASARNDWRRWSISGRESAMARRMWRMICHGCSPAPTVRETRRHAPLGYVGGSQQYASVIVGRGARTAAELQPGSCGSARSRNGCRLPCVCSSLRHASSRRLDTIVALRAGWKRISKAPSQPKAQFSPGWQQGETN